MKWQASDVDKMMLDLFLVVSKERNDNANLGRTPALLIAEYINEQQGDNHQ